MPRVAPETILIAMFLLLTGCGAAPVADPPVEKLVLHETPEAAVAAFQADWNRGDYMGVKAQFLPSRRALLDQQEALIRAQIEGFRVASVDVAPTCHPRGGAWKIAEVRLESVLRDETEVETIWLHLADGAWWMYSL